MVSNTKTASEAAANDDSATIDQDALSVIALAEGILARDFRPRAASVRRLAEAVLAKQVATKKKKKKDKPAGNKAGGKKRKLAKIPGQKGRKSG